MDDIMQRFSDHMANNTKTIMEEMAKRQREEMSRQLAEMRATMDEKISKIQKQTEGEDASSAAKKAADDAAAAAAKATDAPRSPARDASTLHVSPSTPAGAAVQRSLEGAFGSAAAGGQPPGGSGARVPQSGDSHQKADAAAGSGAQAPNSGSVRQPDGAAARTSTSTFFHRNDAAAAIGHLASAAAEQAEAEAEQKLRLLMDRDQDLEGEEMQQQQDDLLQAARQEVASKLGGRTVDRIVRRKMLRNCLQNLLSMQLAGVPLQSASTQRPTPLVAAASTALPFPSTAMVPHYQATSASSVYGATPAVAARHAGAGATPAFFTTPMPMAHAREPTQAIAHAVEAAAHQVYAQMLQGGTPFTPAARPPFFHY
jgi:DNA gyrase/topoisomerase IV subunit A